VTNNIYKFNITHAGGKMTGGFFLFSHNLH